MKVSSGKITGTTIGLNRDAERPARLFQVEITSESDLQTVEQSRRSGEDNNPPLGARVIIAQIGSAWKIAIADEDFIAPEAGAGEKYLYSTDPDGVEKKAVIKLLNTGEITIGNGAAEVQLDAAGNIALDGAHVTIEGGLTVNGAITADNATLAGISVVGHVHGIKSGSSSPGPTDVMENPPSEAGP